MRRKAQWVDSSTDPDKYRLSHAELLQRKVALVSKNRETARQEWQARQELIKQGRLPEELKKVIAPPEKKFTSKSAALKTEKKTIAKFEPKPVETPKSPKVSMLKTTSSAKTFRPKNDVALDEISKLELAMKELEFAMTEAIGPEVPIRNEALSDDSVFSISSEDERDEKQDFKQWHVVEDRPETSWLNSVLRSGHDEKAGTKGSKGSYQPTEILKHNEAAQVQSYERGAKGWSLEVGDEEDSIIEPHTADWENSEYLANLLEQTRKDLAFMSIAEPDLSALEKLPIQHQKPSIFDDPTSSRQESTKNKKPSPPQPHSQQPLSEIPAMFREAPQPSAYTQIQPVQSSGFFTEASDMPRPKAYTLQPSTREPVLRGKLAGQSLALVDHTRHRYII